MTPPGVPAKDGKEPKKPTAPKEIAGYQLLERLSAAGGTVTFRARQKSLGRLVTMTILPPSGVASPGYRTRFDRQVAVASRLRHDNVISAIDAGAAAGCLYVVFEHVDGHTLAEAFARGEKFTPERLLSIARDIGLALDHVAASHLVHRNVVPSSILLVDHGPAKLAGFTAAKVKVKEGHETWFDHDLGSAHYTAPESVQGKRGIDVRADLYSLGCVLYQAATGHTPFGRGTVAEVLSHHVTATPPDPRTHRKDLPEGFVRILDRLLRRLPSLRYQSPAELLKDVEAVQAGRAIERGPGTPLWKDRFPTLELPSILRSRAKPKS